MAESRDTAYNCSVCLEEFILPKMISCGHTFCQRCLENLPRRETWRTKTILCPKCRSEVTLPQSGSVEDFPTNYAVLGALESGRIQNICLQHMKPLDLFCNTCKACICVECFVQKHKADAGYVVHDVTSSTRKASEIIEEVKLVVERLQITKYKNLLDEIAKTENSHLDNAHDIKQKIRKRRDEMIREIREKADELENVVEVVTADKKEKLTELRQEPLKKCQEKHYEARKLLLQVEEIEKYGLSQAKYQQSNNLLFKSDEMSQKNMDDSRLVSSTLLRLSEMTPVIEYRENENSNLKIGWVKAPPTSEDTEERKTYPLLRFSFTIIVIAIVWFNWNLRTA
ncbi:Tripartite motif-containing protein 59 [Holothuria leucospilota]|uniref:Tripartite motif-containing protein 59 n=1 Tax=Holothuria leucospilota TaxID=206669 RepID=A0A9Q1CRS8_HOLLE|nr:Tripartite motif-containing protein 59 [Holothuria leucospilota]